MEHIKGILEGAATELHAQKLGRDEADEHAQLGVGWSKYECGWHARAVYSPVKHATVANKTASHCHPSYYSPTLYFNIFVF